MKCKGTVVCCAILLAFVAAEVAFRIYQNRHETGVLTDRPVVDLYPGIDRPEEIFSLLGPGQLDWSPYEHWVIRPNLSSRFYSTNALGFRGSETTIENPPGRYRVVVLGGSAAWGYGCTADERTVPGRLQTLLREQHPTRNLEVINAAQIGYVSGQQVSYFHRRLKRLDPDLVILFSGYNDVSADFLNPVSGWPQNAALLKARYEASWKQRSAIDDVESLARRSMLIDFLWGRFLPEVEATSIDDRVATPAEKTARNYVMNVRSVAALARPARVVVALQPTVATTQKPLAQQEKQILSRKESQIPGFSERVQAAHAAMADAIDSAGIQRIDLAGALGSEPELLFADECHFGDAAANRIAQRIAEGLSKSLETAKIASRRPGKRPGTGKAALLPPRPSP